MAGPDLLERIDAILTAVLELKRIHSGEGDIGAGGGTIEMALAFSQRREIFPCQGAPRFFFDLVLDPHNYRRHFRLAGNLGSNSIIAKPPPPGASSRRNHYSPKSTSPFSTLSIGKGLKADLQARKK